MPVSESSTRLTTGFTGARGIQPWTLREPYKTYKSPFGPKYSPTKHYHGISIGRAARFFTTAGGFAGVAGFFALFLFAEVPRVRDDIMLKIPVLGDYFVKEIPPEDNPF